MTRSSHLEWLLTLTRPQLRALLQWLGPTEAAKLRSCWTLWAHDGQRPPLGDWHCWLIMAGRGFGKTRAGAEWVRLVAERDAGARIALVAASLVEARRVMVEGPAGLLRLAPNGKRPRFKPSQGVLTWPNGATATIYSAAEPEALRGAQHSHACRASPEGILRQRGTRADRHAAPSRHRRRSRCSAGGAGRRRMLAGRRRHDGSMGRPGRAAGEPSGGDLGLCHAARRPAPARPLDRSGDPLSKRLAAPERAGGTDRRNDGRCPSSRGDRRVDRRTCGQRDSSGSLNGAFAAFAR